MDDFYANYIVRQYNATFKKNIIFACPCYKQYKNFTDYVFTKKNSYFCCLLIVTNDDLSKIVHNCFPIMMGSEIDYTIRKMEKVDCNMYGSFIIKGDYKLIPNFITNNLGTGHVYRTKKPPSRVYIANLKQDRVSLQIRYNPDKDDKFSVTISDDLYVANEAIKRKIDYEQEIKDEVDSLQKTKRKKLTPNKFAYIPNLNDGSKNKSWIEVMNQSSPVPEHECTEDDYAEYFAACLQHAPELDHLANKTSISPPTLLDRVLTHLIKLCKVPKSDRDGDTVTVVTDQKKFSALSGKLKNIFSNGNMFFALSNKFTANVMKEFKCVYQAVDGQKLHLLSKMTSMVKRYVSDQARNSKALKFPVDAFGFIDPINAREMKGAGETIYQSQLVLTSPESDGEQIKRTLVELNEEDGGGLTVAWNGFITNYKLRKSSLAKFKSKCPFASLMIFGEYLNLNTKGHVLMKYSIKYKCFVTPHEAANLFHDAFENYSMHLNFSSMAMMLPTSIVRAQPAKTVVAMSNIKGRCQVLNSKLSIMSFLHTIGTSNAALIHAIEEGDEVVATSLNDETSKPVFIPINLTNPQYRYAKLAETRGAEMPHALKELFAVYRPKSDRSETDALAYEDVVDCRVFKRTSKIYDRWMDNEYMLYVSCPKFREFEPERTVPLTVAAYNRITHNAGGGSSRLVELNKDIQIRAAEKKRLLEKYNEYIEIDTKSRMSPHLLLYCAFGDIGGGTNEDGVILDSTFVENGPTKLMSITLSVKFIEKMQMYKKDANINDDYCKIKYTPINHAFNSSSFIEIGILVSCQPLIVRKSKNVSITESVVNAHYRYSIEYREFSEYAKTVESFYSYENSTVTVHIRYTTKLGVGSKLANLHGQKGVCSTVTDLNVSSVKDLSGYVGFRADGVQVHPQILFSATSIVGRTVSSQVYEMLCNDQVAFTVYGEPIALMAFNVHHIEASVKARMCVTKNDLMTSENGFNANMMTNTTQCLANQGPTKPQNLIHLITQLNIINGVRLQFLDFDANLIEDLDEDTSEAESEEAE